jgi:hypothetical protein
VADRTPQTASAALALVGAAGVTNALAPADRSGGGAAGASASLLQRAAMAREAQTQARLNRIERYRHLTRDLEWQPYRARAELRVTYRTIMRYERTLREQVNA